jgi:probable rRNA maturation factor
VQLLPAGTREAEVETSHGGRISIQVDDCYAGEVDSADLARAVAATLATEGTADLPIEGPECCEVSLVVTSDEAVAQLNRQFRGIEEPTDVLSFAAQEPAPGFVSAPEAATYLGDIIIALPFARRQAAGLGRDLADELRLLAVHGALHLLGYDHSEPDEELEMWSRQDEILAGLQARGVDVAER